MEEQELINAENLTQDGVLELITEFPVKPTRRKLIITVNTAEDISDDGVRVTTNELAESQYVMATGQHLGDEIKPGQKVILNLERMTVSTPDVTDQFQQMASIKLRPLQINGRIYALIDDGVVDALDNRV